MTLDRLVNHLHNFFSIPPLNTEGPKQENLPTHKQHLPCSPRFVLCIPYETQNRIQNSTSVHTTLHCIRNLYQRRHSSISISIPSPRSQSANPRTRIACAYSHQTGDRPQSLFPQNRGPARPTPSPFQDSSVPDPPLRLEI